MAAQYKCVLVAAVQDNPNASLATVVHIQVVRNHSAVAGRAPLEFVVQLAVVKVVLSATTVHGTGCHQLRIQQAVTAELEIIVLVVKVVVWEAMHIGQAAAEQVYPNIAARMPFMVRLDQAD